MVIENSDKMEMQADPADTAHRHAADTSVWRQVRKATSGYQDKDFHIPDTIPEQLA